MQREEENRKQEILLTSKKRKPSGVKEGALNRH